MIEILLILAIISLIGGIVGSFINFKYLMICYFFFSVFLISYIYLLQGPDKVLLYLFLVVGGAFTIYAHHKRNEKRNNK